MKKQMNRAILLLLAFVFVLGLLPSSGFAAGTARRITGYKYDWIGTVKDGYAFTVKKLSGGKKEVGKISASTGKYKKLGVYKATYYWEENIFPDTNLNALTIQTGKSAKTMLLNGRFFKEYSGVKGPNPAKKNGKWGYISNYGNTKIGFKYSAVRPFSDGLASVKKNGKWGAINSKGKLVIGYKYSQPLHFSEGLSRVKVGKKYGYINKKGKKVGKIEYDVASSFSSGRALVKKGGKYGYIDKKGKRIIPLQYKDACDFYKGYAFVSLSGSSKSFGLIDTKGKLIVPMNYLIDEFGPIEMRQIDNFVRYGMMVVQSGKQTGVVDRTGKLIIPLQNTTLKIIEPGLILFDNGSKMGLADKTGKMLLDVTNDKIYPFKKRILVQNQNTFQWLDVTGKVIGGANFDSVFGRYDADEDHPSYADDILMVKKAGKYGLINSNGTQVLPCEYSKIQQINRMWLDEDHFAPLVMATKGGKTTIIDLNGKVVYTGTAKYLSTQKKISYFTVSKKVSGKTKFALLKSK